MDLYWHWNNNDTTLKVENLNLLYKNTIHPYTFLLNSGGAETFPMCTYVCVCCLTPSTRAHTFSAHTDKIKTTWTIRRQRTHWYPAVVRFRARCLLCVWLGGRFSLLQSILLYRTFLCIFGCQRKKENRTHQKLNKIRMLYWHKATAYGCGVYALRSFFLEEFERQSS